MDTRTKILTLEAACGLRAASPAVVTGYFDILRAGEVHQIEDGRNRAAAETLVAFVLPLTGALLLQPARAEMAAGLRMIDYVVTGDEKDLAQLLDALQAPAVIRLETDEARRYGELVQHVRRQVR